MKGNILKYPYEASGGNICPLGGTFPSLIFHEYMRAKNLYTSFLKTGGGR